VLQVHFDPTDFNMCLICSYKEFQMKETTPPKPKITRRNFLKTTWAAAGGLVLVESGALVFAYLQPQTEEGQFGGVISVGQVEDFPPGSVTHIPEGRFYLSRLAEGGFLAIHQRCTHLGCSVPWEQAQKKFVCPCHNSQFTPEGEVLNPPAPEALDLFELRIEDGTILVDTGKLIRRQKFEPDQEVYP
jgi:cytochrome b6-f complex iron-sulfur subunit